MCKSNRSETDAVTLALTGTKRGLEVRSAPASEVVGCVCDLRGRSHKPCQKPTRATPSTEQMIFCSV